MIREVIREAWAESRVKTLAAIPLTIAAVFLGWLWLVVMLEAGSW